MTSTRLDEVPDTTSGVLAGLGERQAAVNAAEIDKLRLTVAWAAMHSADTIVGPISTWSEHAIPMGGQGCPEVAEFCVPELAITLGISHDSATRYLGDAVELAYRLPRVYAKVLTGGLAVWKARHIAQQTHSLPLDGAGFVDTHLAHVAPTIGFAAILRLIEEARVRFDPEEAELRRLDAGEYRRFDINLRDAGHSGTVAVMGTLDYADAVDLDTALTTGAKELAALGNPESVHVRRSLAVGVLARNQLTLDLNQPQDNTGTATGGSKIKARQVVLHVHLADPEVARVEELGPAGGCVSVEQVAGWCTNPDTQVIIKPLIDLNTTPRSEAYEIPDRIREHVILTDPTCVFPQCHRNARACDLDHTVPWAHGGDTTPTNLAPLCRRHHRLKTHGGWTYTTDPDHTHHWSSPHHPHTREPREPREP